MQGLRVMQEMIKEAQKHAPSYSGLKIHTPIMDDSLANYIPVPDELVHAAKVKLSGKKEAMVSLTSGGKLSKWAAEQRKERRSGSKKQKRQMAKESKRRNR